MVESIFIALGVSVALNLLFFIFAFLIKSDVFTDITYASTFVLTTLIVMIIANSYNVASYMLLALVALWSLRLGSYLMIRIWKKKVDHRFDKMRNSFWKFGAFWMLQAITVWLVNIATFIFLASESNDFKMISIILIVLALGFLLYETIADLQKWKWMQEKPGQFINIGLWKSSRHPNYFGEYSFWWMLFIFSIVNDYEHIKWIGLIGPIYITFTLYKLSGVPLLEKRGLQKFADNKNYMNYLNNTPCVIPFIGKKGIKNKWKS